MQDFLADVCARGLGRTRRLQSSESLRQYLQKGGSRGHRLQTCKSILEDKYRLTVGTEEDHEKPRRLWYNSYVGQCQSILLFLTSPPVLHSVPVTGKDSPRVRGESRTTSLNLHRRFLPRVVNRNEYNGDVRQRQPKKPLHRSRQ